MPSEPRRRHASRPLLPSLSSSARRERNLFRLALALALSSALGFGGRAAYLDRRVEVMEHELEQQTLSIRQGETQCTRTVVSTVCDREWHDARRHDLEQWSAATTDARVARDRWTERAIFGTLACLGLFYGIRLVTTGRVRPLWPLH